MKLLGEVQIVFVTVALASLLGLIVPGGLGLARVIERKSKRSQKPLTDLVATRCP